MAVLQHRLSVRDEDALERQVEEGLQRRAERRRRAALVEPGVRTDADVTRRSDEDVAGDERLVLGQPPERLFHFRRQRELLDGGGVSAVVE